MNQNRIASIGLLTLIVLGVILLLAWPRYRVYSQTLRGEAQLREAEFTRQIAELDAEAEVARARGVAEANEIIGASLRDNEAYLRYLWINNLDRGNSEVIYVPTEANLPILESTRGIQGPPPAASE